MNIKATVKRTVSRASVYFTLITAVYTLLVMLVNIGEDTILLSATQVLFHFIFSLLASVAWELFRIKQWHTALRVLIHFGILIFAFCTCFLLPLGIQGSGAFIGVVAFSALYGLVMGVGAAFAARFRKKAQKAEDYVNRFDQKR